MKRESDKKKSKQINKICRMVCCNGDKLFWACEWQLGLYFAVARYFNVNLKFCVGGGEKVLELWLYVGAKKWNGLVRRLRFYVRDAWKRKDKRSAFKLNLVNAPIGWKGQNRAHLTRHGCISALSLHSTHS